MGQKKGNKQATKELTKQRLRELNQLAGKLRKDGKAEP